MTSLISRELLPFMRAMGRFNEDMPRKDLSCELLEEKDKFLVKFEVPGIPKDKIKIEVSDNVLTVSGEREEKVENEKKHYSEFSYGSFVRSFSLPGDVDAENVKAAYENGILTLTVPKTEARKAKRIQIQ